MLLTRFLTRFLTKFLESFLESFLTKVLVQVKAKVSEDEGAACNGVDVDVGVDVGVELVEVVAREVPQLDEESLLIQWYVRGRFIIGRPKEDVYGQSRRRALYSQWFQGRRDGLDGTDEDEGRSSSK
jgi:hypothetical protein